MVTVGDQTYTDAQWAARLRRLERRRVWSQEYGKRPEIRAKRAAYQRAYRLTHMEEHREYNREWMRWYRKEQRLG